MTLRKAHDARAMRIAEHEYRDGVGRMFGHLPQNGPISLRMRERFIELLYELAAHHGDVVLLFGQTLALFFLYGPIRGRCFHAPYFGAQRGDRLAHRSMHLALFDGKNGHGCIQCLEHAETV